MRRVVKRDRVQPQVTPLRSSQQPGAFQLKVKGRRVSPTATPQGAVVARDGGKEAPGSPPDPIMAREGLVQAVVEATLEAGLAGQVSGARRAAHQDRAQFTAQRDQAVAAEESKRTV
jgi:hypothetical protein